VINLLLDITFYQCVFFVDISSYKVKYNSSDGMSNEIITNTTLTTLTDLEPNTTYTLVVEGLTPDNNTVTTSQPETFTTSKVDRVGLAFK